MPIDLARRLTQEGLLSDDELAALVVRRAVFAEPVPVALAALGLVGEDALAQCFERLGFAPARRLRGSRWVKSVPAGMLRALWALPIGETAAGIVVAMADPTDRHALAELGHHLRRPIDPRFASIDALQPLLAQLDPPGRTATSVTQPAPVAPPPQFESDTPVGSPGRSSRSATDRTSHRRSTPAYGELRLETAPDGSTRLVGPGAEISLEAPRSRHLVPASPAIGAFDGGAERSPLADRVETPSDGARLRDSDAPIPLRRRVRAATAPVPRDAMYALGELRGAEDRDAVSRAAVRGMTSHAQRAAFFVLKRGVVQGWEGATVEQTPGAGISREALRNLWIPVTAPSVFRMVTERGGQYAGPLSDSTADTILAAALGGRPAAVLLAPIAVRGHTIGYLYADGLRDLAGATARAEQIVAAVVEALERLLSTHRNRR